MIVYVVCRDNLPSQTLNVVATFSALPAAEAYAREQAKVFAGYLWSVRTGTLELDPAKEIVFR